MKLIKLTLTSTLLCCCAYVQAGDAVAIPNVVPFAKGVDVTAAVRAECQLGEKVASYVEQYSKIVEPKEDLGKGKRVEMEITEVFAPGGGAWSGPKWVEVSGTLKEGDKAVASFRAKRFSGGGAFGGFKGTCKILAKCTKALGKDIAQWIKEPRDNAELGDAK